MVVSLHMGWRHVLFANWPVPPDAVAPHVPSAVSVETFDGDAWLSVVPFTNVDVRPAWLPAGWGLPLPELNLRTYVSHDGDPGVYFFSLDADGIVGVVGARLLHHLPYYYARIDLDATPDGVRFHSRRRHPGARPARLGARYGPTGEAFTAAAGSLEAFLVDRRRYYTEARDGTIRYADIRHDPWPLYRAHVTIEENTLFAANGVDPPAGDPVSLYSPGVDTVASPSRRG